MPSIIDRIFANAIAFDGNPLPLEPSEARQPDTVLGTGEITDGTANPADFRLFDRETALLNRPHLREPRPPPPFGMFPVHVTQEGGSPGDASTQCSFTYTVYDLNDIPLDDTNLPTNLLTPERPRPPLGKLVSPSAPPGLSLPVGAAYRDLNSTLHLWDAGEVPDAAPCP